MQNNKLLFVINELSFFFSHRLSLATAAKQSGYEIHVAAPQSAISDRLKSYGFYFHPIPLQRKGMNIFCELNLLYSLFRLYRKLKPNIVHHFTVKPVLYGSLAAQFSKILAVVNTMTGLGYLFISQSYFTKILRFFSKIGFYFSFRHRNMRVIFQNPDDQQQFIQSRLLKSEITLLIKGSGVCLEEFQALPIPESEKIIVLLPSRLLWDKGVGEFVQAAKILRHQCHIKMVLAGQIDLENPSAISKTQLENWINEDLIEYWGFQSDIQKAFACCHIVCLPSYREGIPRVLIEAAACERPIITTDVPGCRDIVNHRDNGLLVEVKNANALAESILELANNEILRNQFGKRGREIVKNGFSSDLVNRKTLSVYEVLLLERSRGQAAG